MSERASFIRWLLCQNKTITEAVVLLLYYGVGYNSNCLPPPSCYLIAFVFCAVCCTIPMNMVWM